MCQANESIPITGYPDLKTGPDPGPPVRGLRADRLTYLTNVVLGRGKR